MPNHYRVSVAINEEPYAVFQRDERDPARPWNDDVDDELPGRLSDALDTLESALEAEPTNEASHETAHPATPWRFPL